jgi:hypothetical protein
LTKLLDAEVEHHATAMLFDTSKAEIDLYPGKSLFSFLAAS